MAEVISDSHAHDRDNGQTVRLLSLGLLISALMHALVHAAGNMNSTLFPVLKEEFSLTNQQIGLIAAIPLMCQVLLSIPAGLFSDRFGARKLIALSIIMAAAGAFLGSVSLNPWMYIAATTLLTINSTIYHPAAQSYITIVTRPRDMARALGIWNGGGTFGMSLGPLSISILMVIFAFHWRQVYQFWVLPILFGLMVLFFMKDPTEVPRKETGGGEGDAGLASSLLSSNMIMYLASSGVRNFGGSLTSGFLSIWLAETQGWSLADMGLVFGAGSLMGIVASPIGGEMASRFGEKRWAVLSLFASYTCFVLAITLKGYWPFMFFYLAQRFFGILEMPADSAITARLSPPRRRGMGFALSSLPASLVGAVAPIVAAFIADSYGIYPIFIAAAVIYYVGLGVLQFGVKLERPSS